MKVSIGQRIRKYRKKKNLTQKELGKLIGCDGRRISLYELGKVYPSSSILIALADCLEISIDELLRASIPHNNSSAEDLELLELFKELSSKKKNTVKNLLQFLVNDQK